MPPSAQRPPSWASRLAPVAMGLAIAVVVAALVDRAAAAVVLGAPPRSVAAWLAALGIHAALITLATLTLGWLWMVRRAGRRHGILAASSVAGVVTLAALAPVGREITAGPWISAQSFAPVLTRGLPVAAAGLVAVLTGLALRWPATADHRRARGLTGLLWAGGMAVPGLEVWLVARGGFPRTHLAALAIASLLLAAAGLRSGQRITPPRRPGPVLLALAALPIAGLLSWRWILPAVQAELLLHAPTTATVMRTLGLTRKDYLPELLSTPVTRADPLPRPPISLALPRARSIVWVTVDALRGDALPPRRTAGEHPAAPGDTPFLDDFIAHSVAFAHAYAQSSKTTDSMPAMFRSLQTFEDPARLGQPLGTAMAAHGYRTMAVVNEWFLVTRIPETRALLEGFERVEVYEPPDTDQAVPWALALLDEAGDAARTEPFLLWVHLYSSHHPGFGGRPLDDGDGPWPQRYRMTVQWLDGEVQRLWEGLHARGLADQVVLVLGADHGEGLGDNGVERHGTTVFEEEVVVPLVMRVPGVTPAVVEATVGNIDVVPTLYELVGLPPEPTHRGHSLVPLLDDPTRPWPLAYYTRNRFEKVIALVEGYDKLVLDTEAGVAMRFDLRADPTEDVNRFEDDEDDRRLLYRLLRLDPSSLTDDLEDGDPTTRALLLHAIRSLDARAPPEQLDFVLRLAPHLPGDEALAAAAERFDAVPDPDFRLRMLQHLFAEDPEGWSERIVAWLEASGEAKREGGTEGGEPPDALVARLAAQHQPRFAPAWVAGRLSEALRRGPALPWLALVAGWSSAPARDFVEPLTRALQKARAQGSRPAAIAALGVAHRLDGLEPRQPAAAALAAAIVPLCDHGDPTVEVVAVRALARHPAHNAHLRALIDDRTRDLRVRQAALRAIGHAQGEAAVELVEHAAQSPRMMIVSILLLSEIATPRALAALERLRDQPMSHEDAEQALKAIQTVRRVLRAQNKQEDQKQAKEQEQPR